MHVTHWMIVLLYIANTVLFVATASHLENNFSWFSGEIQGYDSADKFFHLHCSYTEPVGIFVNPLHLTITHSASVNSLSPNHHKFILKFLITGPHTDLILNSTECSHYPTSHDHLNLTSLTLLATSVKRHYTMTSECDRKMSLWSKHLSNGSDLHVTLFQFTCHLFRETDSIQHCHSD